MPRSKSQVLSTKEKSQLGKLPSLKESSDSQSQSQSSQDDFQAELSKRRLDSIVLAKRKTKPPKFEKDEAIPSATQDAEALLGDFNSPMEKTGLVSIQTLDGEIQIELFVKECPAICKIFVDCCESEFYDGTSIFRIVHNFILQAGRVSKETSKPIIETIERNPKLSFDRLGVVALTKDAEIVVSLDVCNALDSKYWIFGRVTKDSMEVLKKIGKAETDANDSPIFPSNILKTRTLENPFSSNDEVDEFSPQAKKRKVGRVSFGENTKNFDGGKEKKSEEGSKKQLKREGTVILDEQQALKTFMTMDDSVLTSTPSLGGRSMSLPNIPKVMQRIRPRYPKRLVIIRHGQSEQNAALDLMDPDINALAAVRDADIRLTPLGVWEAGKFLSTTEQFDICFCSPYDRAIQTAESIISQFPYKVRVYKENSLREKEFGRLHGLDAKTVKQRFPLEYDLRQRDGPYWYRFPGGENYPAVEQRVQLFLEKICRDYAGRSVLVVTHQVPYKLFRAIFQYLDEKGVLGLEAVPNCGIQEYLLDRLKTPEGRLKLKNWNYTSYDLKEAPKDAPLPPITRSIKRKKSEFRGDGKVEIDNQVETKEKKET